MVGNHLSRLIALHLCIFLSPPLYSANATWLSSPGSSDFNTGSNWSTGSQPGGALSSGNTDVASFGSSSTEAVTLSSSVELGAFDLTSGAGAYNFELGSNTLAFNGPGIEVSSGSATMTLDGSTLTFNGGSANNLAITTAGGSNTVNFDSGTTGGTTLSINDNGNAVAVNVGTSSALTIASMNTTSTSSTLVLTSGLTLGGDNSDSTLGTGIHITGNSNTITKDGTGTFTVVINAYNNPTINNTEYVINDGIMDFNFQYSTGSTSEPNANFTINNATLNLNFPTVRAVEPSSNFTFNNSIMNVNSTDTCEFFGNFSGSGTLNFNIGTAQVQMYPNGDSNSYSGTTNFNGSGSTYAATFGTVFGTSTINVNANSKFSIPLTSTYANDFVLASGATLTISTTKSGIFTGNISGAGALAVDFTNGFHETATLSGNNSYTGGNTITYGILAGTTNGIQGAIANSDTLQFNQSFTGTYSGVLSGSGSTSIAGGGTVIFTGNSSSYSGTTTVSGATWQVDGNVQSSPVTVESSGVLSGAGSVGAVTCTGSTIAPGDGTPGTLTTNGAVTMDSASTLQIAVSQSSASQLEVNNSATVGGTLALNSTSSSYRSGTYTILSSTALSGNFTTFSSSLPSSVNAQYQIVGNNIMLTITQNAFSQSPVTNLGQAVANFLDSVVQGSPTTAQQNLWTAINDITNPDEFNSALEQIAPAISAPLQTMSIVAQQQEEITVRVAALHNEEFYAAGDSRIKYGIWIRPFYVYGKQNNRGALLGYRAQTGGILLGADKDVTRKLTLGVAASYSYSIVNSINYANTYTHIKNYLGTLYGSYEFLKKAYLDLLFSGGGNKFNGGHPITSSNTFAKSSYNGSQYAIEVILSKDYKCGANTITPKIDTYYIHVRNDAYNEYGAGSLNLNVASAASSVFTAGAGVMMAHTFKFMHHIAVDEVHAVLYYDIKSAAQNVTAGFVTGGPSFLTSATPGRITLDLGASIVLPLKRNWDVKLEYNLQLKSRYYNNIAFANLRYVF